MTLMNILKKLSILIVAILAIHVTRMGVNYFTILLAIGIIMPIICGSKKSAVFTGILYATLSYIITYPSSLFLINYMPRESIPITVSTATVYSNLLMGWIIPVIITIVVCGIFSVIGLMLKRLFDKLMGKGTDEHYFKEEKDSDTIITDSFNRRPEYSYNNNSFNGNRDYSYDDYSFNRNDDYYYEDNSFNPNHDYSYEDNSFNRNKDYSFDANSLNKKEKKELLYMTPIQKAKNRKKRNGK
ncbi:MAG TPA: hypothetical protein HA277_00510 [Methanosphaera sp.]|nr:hypothetical protein [Methanosphaera sp.]HIJ14871.1 hypothetical protein [Methanosphaera sp.]